MNLENFKSKSKEVLDKVSDRTQKVIVNGLALAKKGVDWAKKNPQKAAQYLGTAVFVGYKLAKMKNSYDIEHEHDKEIWDPKLGMWMRVRRKLTYEEELNYKDSLRYSDQTGKEILDSMGLLK